MKFFSLVPIAIGAIVASAAPATNGPTHHGSATVANFGLGACGVVSADSELVVGVSEGFFDHFPGATSNPNNNPVCGRRIFATYQGKSVTATITDKCGGCGQFDLNLSPAAFGKLANTDLGSISPVTWHLIGGGE